MAIELANDLLNVDSFGKGLKCPLESDPATGDLASVTGEDSVREDIANLIMVRVGQRVMNEDRGTLLSGILFESQESMIDLLPPRVVETIVRYEPRVYSVTASAKPLGEHAVTVDVQWVLRTTGRRGSLVWPYYLENGTNG